MEGDLGGAQKMSYSSIEWLPLAAGLTVLGLVLSYLTYRRRGLRPALMGTALSLLPIAAYLTGAIEMLWKVGVAIGQFGTGFVFSPEKWAGIGVTGLAVALFLAAGGRGRRKAAREARRAPRPQWAGPRPRRARRCCQRSATGFPRTVRPPLPRLRGRARPPRSLTMTT